MPRFLVISFLFLSVFATAFAEIKYAKNFEIEKLETHTLITIRNTWVGSGNDSQVYALVPKVAAKLPELPSGAIVVRTPIERLVIMGTVFLGPIQDLNLHDSLIGIASLKYANDPIAHQRVEQGLAKEVQSGTAMDIESMLLLRPELILTSTTGNPSFDIHPQMVRAGLPVVVTAGYMEEHPLARTEWIKFIAEFYDKEDDATEAFDAVERRYQYLAKLAVNAETRPSVMVNAPFGGVWHVSGGRSYMATALRDAGANYLWGDNQSRGGVPLDFEVILKKAAKADYWLNMSSYRSISELLSADERFVGFESLQKKAVYNKTLRLNENGGNDIYERGVSHPEQVLADLIKIFHPELVPDHEFIFYEKLK